MAKPKAAAVKEARGIRGELVLAPLASVKPNAWNPNRMTDAQKASLQHGLLNDGWLASQALLVWRTDDVGVEHNVIIDGEHRYFAALAVGMEHGPMVHLDGVPESEAKALTIKMNQKRGEFEEDKLGELLRELVIDDPALLTDAMLEFGFTSRELSSMIGSTVDAGMGLPPPVAPPPLLDDTQAPRGTAPGLRVPLVFYVPVDELEKLRAPFLNPDRPTELRADVLREMVATWTPRA